MQGGITLGKDTSRDIWWGENDFITIIFKLN